MNNKWENRILAQVLNIVIWVIWELQMVISAFQDAIYGYLLSFL